MNKINNIGGGDLGEIDLKSFLDKILQKKWLFAISLLACMSIAYVMIKLATPVYEVKTSLLIDSSGKSRMLGDSKYMDGGVRLIEMEKNIFNEIGIIKSHNLIKKTLEDLKFNISYHSENWYKAKENYGYFPFEVELLDKSPQLYNAPIYIEILSDQTFRLSIQTDEFEVSNPATGTYRKLEKDFNYSATYSFGEEVVHDYFHFILRKPSYKVNLDDFQDLDLFFKVHKIARLTSVYTKKLKVSRTEMQGSIVKLQTKGPVVKKEIVFLKKLCENYIDTKIQERDQIAFNKESFIRNQLVNIADSLRRAEWNLAAFRRNTRTLNLNQTASNLLNQVQTLQTTKAQKELNVKYYDTLLTNLNDSLQVEQITAPSVVGINDPVLNANLMELKRLHTEKTGMAFYKGAMSPDLEMLDQQIENTKKQVEENIKNLKQSAQMEIGDLNNRIGGAEMAINVLPSSEKQLLTHQRKSNLYESLFNYLNQELAKTGIARAEDTPDTKILNDPQMVGLGPVSPQKKLIMALAMIIGLCLPMMWLVFSEIHDDTIQDEAQIEAIPNFPLIASIFHYRPFKRKTLSIKKSGASWKIEESFRDLSANMHLLARPKKNVIGFTSTIQGEGKTFCITNLGLSLAKMGKKVLLIDADFRNPSIFRGVNRKKDEDFSSYLLHERELEEGVIKQHNEFPSLHYIPAHFEEGSPHVLLASSRWEELISQVKQEFDYVLIDAPALGLVSDYLLISKYIDLHLFVLRRKVSKLSFLKDMQRWKKKGRLKKTFLLYNDAIGKTFKYGYTYYTENKRPVLYVK